jgi:hypothetical protein
MPAFLRPMKAIKSPMPTAMANFIESGTAFSTASRKLVRTRIVISSPSATTAAIAVCHGKPRPSMSV